MSVLKCKMCGGTIEYVIGTTVGECQHCGTKQTLPKTSDEVLANLFNRANNLRLKCDFDKAMSIYEKIVEQDDSEAEAHWGIVLCRYGIEYVEDPTTKKRIPTCHRTLYDAVTKDPDYKAAIDYSDTLQQTIYEREAKEIDKIQKGILAIVQTEEPFDVFICYKETDENGNRTKDSVIANDIYHQLTLEGYKVFYAAITLEDKLGQEYEPYIFAALNTAKVMLVIGSKTEYFNAVWVRNEWSRFLNLMKTDRSKILIPCYKDMDAYELPEEFSHLQAQDMSKLGFMLDLNRVIKKIVNSDEQKPQINEVPVTSSDTNIAPLLKRAFMFLEDNNWAEADAYCEKVLDQDPENAQAYIGKLMAELHVGHQDKLADCKQPFDTNTNYKKAVRFGDDTTVSVLNGYITTINERIKKEKLTETYNCGIKKMNKASDELEYKEAARIFESIFGFQKSGALYRQCMEKAEVCRKDAIYNSARKQMSGASQISGYFLAIKMFSSIPDWKDSKEQINACQKSMEKIKADQEAERQRYQRKIEEEKLAEEKAAKRFKIISRIVIIVVIVGITFGVFWDNVLVPAQKYNDAVELYNSGNYEKAIEAFRLLEGYKDSEEQIIKCEAAIKDQKYTSAVELYDQGKYDEALAAFKAINVYKDSEDQIIKCETAIMYAKLDTKYVSAVELYNSGKYDEAIAVFRAMNGYKDSEDQIIKCETAIKDKKYASAIALYNTQYYQEAIEEFKELNGYKDSANKIEECTTGIKQAILAQLSNASIGSLISFGTYEQDNNIENGKENIDWWVLDKEDNKILVLSKYALDGQPYNELYEKTTWEECTLRKWLNNTFLNEAFSEVERTMIPEVMVMAEENANYNTDPGNNTLDHVFLLSISEFEKYLEEAYNKYCISTRYADYASGVWTEAGICCWLLRTPGYNEKMCARVYYDRTVSYYGIVVDNANNGVRPAIWISLE